MAPRTYGGRAACCSAAVVALAVAGLYARGCARDYGDLSKRPAVEVFGRVFQTAPPPGVTDLRATGYCPFDGEAWLTFRAADVDRLIAVLKRNPKQPIVGPDRSDGDTMRDWVEGATRYNPATRPAQRLVGWGLLDTAAKLEYYTFPSASRGTGWSGWIAVDRPRRRFFVYAVLS